MKVSDFFSGILKMFNLTCISFDETNYRLEQLEDWYLQGDIKDITDYTITDLEVERIKIFKNVIFKYQQGQSFINQNYRDRFKKEYGDAVENFENDGSDYTIELPFEKLQFARIGGGSLNVAFALQGADLQPYIPKPVLFYVWKNVSTTPFYVSGSSAVQVSDYLVCGDFTEWNFSFHSNNFGQEQSVQTGGQLVNSLFLNYYSNYISNLYRLQSRLVKAKAVLPVIDLVKLKLNDRVVIRGVRYVINQFTTNLNTGEIDFELIKDFRESVGIISQTITTPPAGGTVFIPVNNPGEVFTPVVNPTPIRVVDPTIANPFLEVIIGSNTSGVEIISSVEGSLGSFITVIQQP